MHVAILSLLEGSEQHGQLWAHCPIARAAPQPDSHSGHSADLPAAQRPATAPREEPEHCSPALRAAVQAVGLQGSMDLQGTGQCCSALCTKEECSCAFTTSHMTQPPGRPSAA